MIYSFKPIPADMHGFEVREVEGWRSRLLCDTTASPEGLVRYTRSGAVFPEHGFRLALCEDGPRERHMAECARLSAEWNARQKPLSQLSDEEIKMEWRAYEAAHGTLDDFLKSDHEPSDREAAVRLIAAARGW